MSRAYSIKTLAAEWGCSEPTIRAAIADGSIRHFRIGKLIRITAEEVALKSPRFVGSSASDEASGPDRPSANSTSTAEAFLPSRKSLPDWPGAMRLRLAAAYCDLSLAEFEREVAAGVLPAPIPLGRGKRWSRRALDSAVAALYGEELHWRDGSPLYPDRSKPNPLDRLREVMKQFSRWCVPPVSNHRNKGGR
jgi:excisionase family DNA binding protein